MIVRQTTAIAFDDPDEQFGVISRDGHYIARYLVHDADDLTYATVYLHRVFQNGRITVNSSKIIRMLVSDLPDLVRDALDIPAQKNLTETP